MLNGTQKTVILIVTLRLIGLFTTRVCSTQRLLSLALLSCAAWRRGWGRRPGCRPVRQRKFWRQQRQRTWPNCSQESSGAMVVVARFLLLRSGAAPGITSRLKIARLHSHRCKIWLGKALRKKSASSIVLGWCLLLTAGQGGARLVAQTRSAIELGCQ